MAQWEVFLKKRPYSGSRRNALPTAPPTLPASASASLEAGRPAPLPRPPTPPSEVRGRSGEMEGVPRMGFREVSFPPPSHRSVGEEGGGGWVREPQLL